MGQCAANARRPILQVPSAIVKGFKVLSKLTVDSAWMLNDQVFILAAHFIEQGEKFPQQLQDVSTGVRNQQFGRAQSEDPTT